MVFPEIAGKRLSPGPLVIAVAPAGPGPCGVIGPGPGVIGPGPGGKSCAEAAPVASTMAMTRTAATAIVRMNRFIPIPPDNLQASPALVWGQGSGMRACASGLHPGREQCGRWYGRGGVAPRHGRLVSRADTVGKDSRQGAYPDPSPPRCSPIATPRYIGWPGPGFPAGLTKQA